MALPVNGSTSDSSLLLIYRPRKDERLSWPSWLTFSVRFTHISCHPSAAGRAQDRESSPARDRRSTTATPPPAHPGGPGRRAVKRVCVLWQATCSGLVHGQLLVGRSCFHFHLLLMSLPYATTPPVFLIGFSWIPRPGLVPVGGGVAVARICPPPVTTLLVLRHTIANDRQWPLVLILRPFPVYILSSVLWLITKTVGWLSICICVSSVLLTLSVALVHYEWPVSNFNTQRFVHCKTM